MIQSEDRSLPRPLCLDPVIHKYANPFIRKIENEFQQALVYQHKDALENAKRIIPYRTLNERMLKKYETIKMAYKKDPKIGHVDPDDLIIVELLHWFKEEFFEWVDSPDCDYCRNKTLFSHIKNDSQNKYAKRIEIFKCEICGRDTPFPRYNDVNILLETRKGRCGEWANVFTLLCCAMNFDARLVVDETDHVWTEVYSHYQKRWLHCDPCENVCDNPLMYEQGWKKNLSYIMAYSPNEVQDVTWRYTSDFKDIMKRRTLCSESDLVKAIVELRNERLSKFSKAKRDYILKRTVVELTDFLTERKPGDENYVGRTSGSLDWRIARGDISERSPSSYHFKITFQPKISKLEYSLKYSCSSDKYIYGTDLQLSQWDQATHYHIDMMRKVEKDWNKVYLCRREGTAKGTIAWMLQLMDTKIKISSVYLKFHIQTFENGRVNVCVTGKNKDRKEELRLDQGNDLKTMAFRGCENLCIEATLSGGVGSTAWQHAQLFRQDWRSIAESYPFELFLTFEENFDNSD